MNKRSPPLPQFYYYHHHHLLLLFFFFLSPRHHNWWLVDTVGLASQLRPVWLGSPFSIALNLTEVPTSPSTSTSPVPLYLLYNSSQCLYNVPCAWCFWRTATTIIIIIMMMIPSVDTDLVEVEGLACFSEVESYAEGSPKPGRSQLRSQNNCVHQPSIVMRGNKQKSILGWSSYGSIRTVSDAIAPGHLVTNRL